MPKRSTQETREELERELSRFLDRHVQGEAYGFDIKIQKIEIPPAARRSFDEQVIEDTVQSRFREALIEFTDQLQAKFHWIHRWSQEGRSGGWLVIEPDYGLIDQEAGIQTLRNRLRDLNKIHRWVREAERDLINELESDEFWNVKKQDWSPRD